MTCHFCYNAFLFHAILQWINILPSFLFISPLDHDTICAQFKQMQRLGCKKLKPEVWTLPHQCINRLHTSASDCAHPSRCFCLNRAQMKKWRRFEIMLHFRFSSLPTVLISKQRHSIIYRWISKSNSSKGSCCEVEYDAYDKSHVYGE